MKGDTCNGEGCSNVLKDNSLLCSTCRDRKYRALNPIRWLFYKNKNNAKSRGINWWLTFEEFKEFCEETMYHLTVGRSADGMTINRMKEELGYQKGNIEVITLADNVRQQNEDRRKREEELMKLKYGDRYINVLPVEQSNHAIVGPGGFPKDW